jgi:phage host-nuclease inhibitor protein Gam
VALASRVLNEPKVPNKELTVSLSTTDVSATRELTRRELISAFVATREEMNVDWNAVALASRVLNDPYVPNRELTVSLSTTDVSATKELTRRELMSAFVATREEIKVD